MGSMIKQGFNRLKNINNFQITRVLTIQNKL